MSKVKPTCQLMNALLEIFLFNTLLGILQNLYLGYLKVGIPRTLQLYFKLVLSLLLLAGTAL
jgi:hypothetical protein